MTALSISSLSCDGFGDNDFRETLAVLPQLGCRYAELNMWYPQYLTPAYVKSLKERCSAAGIIPVSVYSSGFGGNLVKDVSHKIRMIEAAAELGCRRIVVTGENRDSENLEENITALEMVVPFAEEKDVLVCLENHEGNTFENIEDYSRIFSRISSSHVGLCIDTGHFEAAGVRLKDVIDTFHDRINHIHVKENRQFGRKQFVRFGEGETDNAYAVERMISYGYDGYIDIELSPEIIGADGRPENLSSEDLKKAVNLFSRFADQQ